MLAMLFRFHPFEQRFPRLGALRDVPPVGPADLTAHPDPFHRRVQPADDRDGAADTAAEEPEPRGEFPEKGKFERFRLDRNGTIA